MSQLSYWKVLTRRKPLADNQENEAKLNRILGTFDLTALGVGATLGVGVYVLAGHVARDQAGPSVVLSFLIAAVTSLLAGLCYAEFGARVPKAGSAYIYSYVCIGELAAFTIGWNLILEYIIGSASVSRGISLYLDTIINDTLKITFVQIAPIEWGFLGGYFDFFAFSIAFILGVCLAFGIQTSTVLTNIFTILNVGIIIFVIIAGSIKADIANWQIDPAEVKDHVGNLGSGGFFPFGFEGTLKGAATCFFGFVGFDCIATTGEEVRNPQRAIPRAILYSLLIIFLTYFGISTVLTLMWPYYLQDIDAPIPFAFQETGWPAAKWIVTIGGLIGLVASLIGTMFPLPRIIYAMSQDGLLFRFLGQVSPKYKSPVVGTVCAAFLTGLFAALFDLTQLVNMLSIGTLMAYTIVAISITILRFMDNTVCIQNLSLDPSENTNLNGSGNRITYKSSLTQIFNMDRLHVPTVLSTRVVGILLGFYCLCCLGFSLIMIYAQKDISNLEPWALTVSIILFILLVVTLLAISVQPREDTNPVFHVPLIPLLPGISIFVNIYLMLQLDIYTWIRFGVWMTVGLPIYLACIFLYSHNEVTNQSLIEKRTIRLNGTITSLSKNWPPKDYDNDLQKNNTDTIQSSSEETPTIMTIENEASSNDDGGNIIIMKQSDMCDEIILKPPKTPSPKQSFDEIIPASELSECVKEIRNPSGKVFFIEDNSSKNIEQVEQDEEDAKSVIAILDDVLQIEDAGDSVVNNSNEKVAEPSVTTLTVAMIHNSYDCLKEDEETNSIEDKSTILEHEQSKENCQEDKIQLENVSNKEEHNNEENEVENNLKITLPPLIIPIINNENDKNKKTETSNDEQQNLINNNNNNNKTDLQIPEISPSTISPIPSRKSSSSNSSQYSSDADEDALHSRRFKQKLNKLISRPPLFSQKLNKFDDNEGKLPKSTPQTPNPQTFKTSKSEPDLQQFVKMKNDNEEAKSIENVGDSGNSESSSNIPKAPTFDPILYKSVGTRRHNQYKERPKLDVLIPNGIKEPKTLASPVVAEKSDSTPTPESPPLPFKEKLAALLQRGPSHKIAKFQPIIPNTIKSNGEIPQNSTIDQVVSQPPPPPPKAQNIHSDKSNVELTYNFSDVLKAIRDRRQSALSINRDRRESELSQATKSSSRRPSTIEEARSSLKPVQMYSNIT